MSTDDARPAGVPDGAVWNQGDREWELAELDAEGHKHGVTRWWRPDGTLCCTTDYVDGLAHGVFRRTHENGEPSRTGRFERGVLHGTNVFVRSTAATTEVFPPGVGAGVWTVEMDYDRGKIVEARAYDRLGNRVTDDGSPFPTERPEGVPTAATFRKREADRQWRWVHGQVIDRNDGTIARVGQWRFWTPDGVLVADEWYAEGKLHGTVATFDPETGAALELTAYRDGARHGPSEKRDPSGRVIARVEYTDGKATGAFEREAEPGRYHDPRAVIERGTQVDGDVATLTLVDAAGLELVTITMSAKVDQRVLSDVLGGDLPSLSTITALDQSGQRTVAFLAAALAGVDPAALRERLAAFRPPLTEESRQRQTYSAKMVASNVVRFGGRPVAVLSSLLNGIREGGDPAELLRQAAASIDDHGDTALASRLIDAAVALDPENTGHEYTRALVRMSLGDPDGAAASIARLDGPFVNAVPSLDAYRRALFSDLGAWVDDDPRLALALRVAPLLGRTTLRAAPPAALVERTIHQGITRLLHARTELTAQFGDHPWLPPDLSAQLPSGPVESPLPSGGIGLLHHARRDALRLRWLCWSLGLDEVAVPARVAVAPDRPSRALALVVIARAVQLQSGSPPTEAVIADWIRDEPPATVAAVHALLAEAIPTSTWFGLPLNDTGPAQRDFAFEDELALFKLLLTWWGEPNERTAFEAADADDDSDDSDDSDEDEE